MPMNELIRTCEKLGIQVQKDRTRLLKLAIKKLLGNEVLFFICAHDYLRTPTTRKFAGFWPLFIAPNAEYPLNLFEECQTDYFRVASVTRTSSPGTSMGHVLRGDPDYLSRVNALDLIVTHAQGLQHQNTLNELVSKFTAAKNTPVNLGESVETTFAAMSTHVAEYWGTDVTELGLAPTATRRTSRLRRLFGRG